jgi:hypothetical protein
MPAMKYRKIDTRFGRRANEVREIAKGIYDDAERDVVLRFVADAERAVLRAPEVPWQPMAKQDNF